MHHRIPILESETSPHKIRGNLLVSWQTFVAVGILLSASVNCIFHKHWRLQIGTAFLPAVPLLCLCYVIPESVFLSLVKSHDLIFLQFPPLANEKKEVWRGICSYEGFEGNSAASRT